MRTDFGALRANDREKSSTGAADGLLRLQERLEQTRDGHEPNRPDKNTPMSLKNW
jgi:hypothetical protein